MALPVKNIKITQHELGLVTHNCSPSSQEVRQMIWRSRAYLGTQGVLEQP